VSKANRLPLVGYDQSHQDWGGRKEREWNEKKGEENRGGEVLSERGQEISPGSFTPSRESMIDRRRRSSGYSEGTSHAPYGFKGVQRKKGEIE